MARDPFDLGFVEQRYETEHWQPSQDYPQVTVHVLRREGDRVIETSTDPWGRTSTGELRIRGVFWELERAELVRANGVAMHFDLAAGRPIEGGRFDVMVTSNRDALDPATERAVLEVLAAGMPRVRQTFGARPLSAGVRDASGATFFPMPSSVAPDDTSWMAREVGATPGPPAVAGLRVTQREAGPPTIEAIESSALVTVDFYGQTVRVQGYLQGDLAQLDAMVGRLRAVLTRA